MTIFELVAKLTLDSSEYEDGLDDARDKASSFGKTAVSTIGKGLATAAKVGAAAIGAAATGISALTKSAVRSYGEYEQLVGGVETLFKDSADVVMKYARGAFQSAGLSANEYMQTVTSFSASLLQSVGGDTEKAANVADMAIRDMSDNANKMGTDMASIQVAYQGFAKQNYMMLDNLKLGYGGTKTEMERLLKDATAISGVKYDISSLQDVYEAIHVIQGELGITGTTAKEASSTIQGSLASIGSAWKNLVTGLGDEDADIGALIDDVISGAETALGNMLPVVDRVLGGIATAIEKIAPILAKKFPALVNKILPPLLNAASSLVSGFVSALPTILKTISDVLPDLIGELISLLTGDLLPDLLDAGLAILSGIGRGILENLPQLISGVQEIILSLSNYLVEAIPELLPAIVEMITSIVEMLTQPEMLGNLVDAAISIIFALVDGLIAAIPILIENLPQIIINIVQALIENAPKLLEAGVVLIAKLIEGLGKAAVAIFNAGKELVIKIGEGIASLWEKVKNWASDIWEKIKEGFEALWEKIKTIGRNIIEGIWEGIKAAWNWITEKVGGFFSGLVDWIKDLLGIHSPSTVFADIGKNMIAGLGKGFDDSFGKLDKDVKSKMQQLTDDATVSVSSNANFGEIGLGYSGKNADVQVAGGVYSTIISLLTDIRDRVGGDVVLDSGELVGYIDSALGTLSTAKARGMA